MNIQDYIIAKQSHTLLDGQGGETFGLYEAVEAKLATIADPEVSWSMESGDTGLLRALTGKRRELLRIQHRRFREYTVMIAARAHGTALHVSWLLMVSPSFLKDVRRATGLRSAGDGRFEIGSELDPLDVLDLDAFVAETRLALRAAVHELTELQENAEEAFSETGLPGME